MRKVKLQTQISIDGFIAGPNGEMDWMVWNWNEALIKHGLIDEYHLFVNPSALGSGMSIFQGLENRQAFKLIEARSFECAITLS